MQTISFKYTNKRTRVALLLNKRDESKSQEVQVLLYDESTALIILYHNVILCDIVFINGEQFLRRNREVFTSDDYIDL